MGKINDTQILAELIKGNPKLPIVAMVNTDSFGDDTFAYLAGDFYRPKVDEYVIGRYNEILLKSDYSGCDKYSVLEDVYGSTDCEDLSDDEVEKVYNELPWQKAIIVYVE